MSALHLEALSVTRAGCQVLRGVTLSVGSGECVGLIGPNGAGKTTLLRAAMGLLPSGGRSSLAMLAPKARARAVAWLPQSREIVWPVTVETLVSLGRLAHGPARVEDPAVLRAIGRMRLGALRQRLATGLSGGEQARVLIARALAQEAPVLLADEPVAGLDPAARIETMRVFRSLAAEGRAVVVALHDLALAARHCTRLVALSDGCVVADGLPAEVLGAGMVARVFGIRAAFSDGPDGPVFQVLDVVEAT